MQQKLLYTLFCLDVKKNHFASVVAEHILEVAEEDGAYNKAADPVH